MAGMFRFVAPLVMVLLPTMAAAGPNAEARILFHLTYPTSRNACGTRANPAWPSVVATTAPLYPVCYFAYVLVAEGSPTAGVGGVSFGIEYDAADSSGVDIFSWHLCADAESPTAGWPASGTGNTVSWNPDTNCQRSEPGGGGTGVMAGAGYFYLTAYTPDLLYVRPHPVTGLATVTSCTGVEDVIAPPDSCHTYPYPLGFAGFGGYSGYNPCAYHGGCPCQITGPPNCTPGSKGNRYDCVRAPNWMYESYYWRISGNGTIDSTFGGTAWVTAGTSGAFTLSLGVSWFEWGSLFCDKVVTVADNVPVQSTTWGGIKALYR